MTSTKKSKIQELWEKDYKEYVKNQLITKIEALKMIANELGIYVTNVEKEIDTLEKNT